MSSQAGLHINWQKCRFIQTEIIYLGHVVTNKLFANRRDRRNVKLMPLRNFQFPNALKMYRALSALQVTSVNLFINIQ